MRPLHCLWNGFGYWNNDNDAPTVATIAPASATEGSPAVFEFSFKLLLRIQRIPLHSPMEPGLHYHLQTVTYLRVHYWNGIGTNNC
jgi:hypothetical protein